MTTINHRIFLHTIALCSLLGASFLISSYAMASNGHDHSAVPSSENAAGASASSQRVAKDDDHKEDDKHGEHEEEGHLKLSPERTSNAGITTAAVSSQEITQSLLLYGRTEPDPQRVSHVRARFPGLIRSVLPALGDTVKAGEPIAEIESNDSLRRYTLKAPIAGTVVERHANTGEFADEQPLMTIADYSQLWVSLNIFPREAEHVRAGQRVYLSAGNRTAASSISFLNPGTGRNPNVMARLPLANAEANWTPGLLVEGSVIIDKRIVRLAVDNRALQTVEQQTVVFVATEDGFQATPVKLGRQDDRFSEVLEGVHEGDTYAVDNSYLLKAELEKSGASHDH